MKTRIMSAVVGLILLAVILLLFDTIALNIIISFICIVATYEVLHATNILKNKAIAIISMLFSGLLPFSEYLKTPIHISVFCFIYAISLFIVLILDHNNIKAESIGFAFLMTLLISCSLSTTILIRYKFADDGLFYVMLGLAGAWIADAGAYFCGRFFGKHKLAPTISPNKTIEGAVGGLIVCTISFILLGLCYKSVLAANDINATISYFALIVIGVSSSVMGMLGDLTASIIKRQNSVKDFGNIMPGHGGMLDRFDSVLFVMPFVFTVLTIFPVVLR